ncbi:hypothetical protein [Flexithrix dorotheae]|uniref:hypothetical protein n=1 Tax=Flexithrix dorotheae TaxID=70993 RepID=UPI00036BD892|nr:hypothetical protein [Flexithrix dorotheae]
MFIITTKHLKTNSNILIWLLITGSILIGCNNEEHDICGDFVPGEIMIKTYDTIPQENLISLVDSYKLSVERVVSERMKIYLINVPEGEESHWVNEFKNEKIIKFSQLNHYVCPRNNEFN